MFKRNILLILITSIILVIVSCTSPDDARRALESAGYTNIQTDGYDFFACGEHDFFHTKFTATNSNGKRISGTVCSGLFFKKATIRF